MAVDVLPGEAERELPGLMSGLDLTVQVGAVTLFGPRRGTYVLVRSAIATSALLDLQRGVAEVCGADPQGQFGPGRWTPHLTLARRVTPDQLAASLAVLGAADGVSTGITGCRRWDSEARRDWSLTNCSER